MLEIYQIIAGMFAARGVTNFAKGINAANFTSFMNKLSEVSRVGLAYNMGGISLHSSSANVGTTSGKSNRTVASLATRNMGDEEHPNVENTAVDLAAYPMRKSQTVLNFGRQGYQYVVERFGKFSRVEKPGIFWTIPFIEKTLILDTRQMVIDVAKQNAYTSDNVAVKVAAQLYISIVNVEHACYKVSQPLIAVMSKAQAALRTAIGQNDLDHLLKDRNSINNAVNSALNNSVEEWGIHVIRFEITELSPDKRIQEAMDLQSTAERERRSSVIAAEGRKRAMELDAEGKKRAVELEAEALDKMANIVAKIPSGVLAYNVQMKHIDMVQKLAGEGKHNTYFVPKDISALPAFADMIQKV